MYSDDYDQVISVLKNIFTEKNIVLMDNLQLHMERSVTYVHVVVNYTKNKTFTKMFSRC